VGPEPLNQLSRNTVPADMTFAERLTALRKHHSLTHQALADRVGIHVTLLRRYEAGKTQPNLDTLRQIALALSIGADLLLFDEDDAAPQTTLRLQFEATQRLTDDEKTTVKRVLEGLHLAHEAKRWAA
jgi:transcriptional regulator with XRE-family HTH domain